MKWFGILMICIPFALLADVYKCQGADGKVVFSDTKCGDKAQIVDIKIHAHGFDFTHNKEKMACLSGVTTTVRNLHYPALTDVAEAKRRAETSLKSFHYRKAIQKVDPSGEMPKQVTRVEAEAIPAFLVEGFSDGVVVHARICK